MNKNYIVTNLIDEMKENAPRTEFGQLSGRYPMYGKRVRLPQAARRSRVHFDEIAMISL